MKFILKIVFFLFGFNYLIGQNLVPNGSFEDRINYPTDQGMIGFANNWISFNKTGADYYYLGSYVDKYDKVEPLKGKGYAGIFVLFPGTNPSFSIKSEWISTKLANKLIKNQSYYIEFFIYISNLYNRYNLSINNISAVFTNNSIENLSNKQIEKIITNIKTKFENDSIDINSPNSWIKIHGNFKANGDEEFMTIGNFDPLEKIRYVSTNGDSKKIKIPEYKRFYFYIDEIKVIPIDEDGKEIIWDIKDSITIVNKEGLALDKTIKINNIYFESGNSLLKEESYNSLDSLYQQLLQFNKSEYEIEISGHTDNIGKEDDNLNLSKLRAQVVASYFINKGIKKEIIKYVGYGSSKPLSKNYTEKEREMNRRVELIITKKER